MISRRARLFGPDRKPAAKSSGGYSGPRFSSPATKKAAVEPLSDDVRSLGMARSATDIVHDIINAAVVDAIVALKDASKGLPNVLLRDMSAIHANTAFADLPASVQSAVAASVRGAFTQLQKDGYVIAEAKSVQAPGRSGPRPPGSRPPDGPRGPAPRPGPRGRPRPSR